MIPVAALMNSNMPAVLVASKCEAPEEEQQVNADELANHTLFKSCLAHFKISSASPEIDRSCLHAILRAAVAHRRGMSPRMKRDATLLMHARLARADKFIRRDW